LVQSSITGVVNRGGGKQGVQKGFEEFLQNLRSTGKKHPPHGLAAAVSASTQRKVWGARKGEGKTEEEGWKPPGCHKVGKAVLENN